MATCFVIQPFDGSTFDKRYTDVFEPAIRAADLEPYRIDKDPKVSIPIEDIQNGIRQSKVCLADITLDNPNVWFELGFAIASGKEVILLCSNERRSKFPFDVQHRAIITYTTASISDFELLKSRITAKINASVAKIETLSNVADMSKLTKFEGLEQLEVVALVTIAQNLEHPDDHASIYQLKRDMEASGFTKVATILATKSLAQKEYIVFGQFQEPDYPSWYTGYTLTETGWSWVLANKDKFVIQKPEL